jgi:hypothetical protein
MNLFCAGGQTQIRFERRSLQSFSGGIGGQLQVIQLARRAERAEW